VRRDQYAPHTTAGRWLIAHEIAHAVGARQAAGAPRHLGGTRDRAEAVADRTADRVLRGPLSPGEPLTAAAADGVVRRAPPAGTLADPVKIALFKTDAIYKSIQLNGYAGKKSFSPYVGGDIPTPRMRTAAAVHGAPTVNKQIGGVGGLVKGVTIGVNPPSSLIGTIFLRIPSPPRKVETIFKSALKGRGFKWAGFAPDHLQDLALSGPDKFTNLWPLDSATNLAANQTYGQKVAVQGEAHPVSVKSLAGKYLKIVKVKKP
jgi:hypothetical protein